MSERLAVQSTQQLLGTMNGPASKAASAAREHLGSANTVDDARADAALAEPAVADPAAADAAEAMGGSSLDDFEVLDKLGAGGNASVHLAIWKKTGQRVALKIIHGDLSDDPKYLARFRREVRAASGLHHDNICRVFAWGMSAPGGEQQGGKLFMAMEVIEGGTVADLIERAGRLPPQMAASILAQLLAALGCAHDAGILHRDVKPANAMVTRDGVLKLVDFGIAKGRDDATVTETGFLVGTPAYMSPEQAVGKEIDARTDLYAAGVFFYEMLLGENPYANETPSNALLRIATEAMPSLFEQQPSVPGIVEAVLERLVERDRDARYRAAGEAIADLRPYLAFVDEVHPTLMAAFVADPRRVTSELVQEQAELELARAERLLLAGDVNLPAAALALYRARTLSNTIQIAHRFEHVCARGPFVFGADDDDVIRQTRQGLERGGNPAGPLKRLADLYRARGDVHRAVVFLRRYLREKPGDSHALHQLELLVAGAPVPALTPQGRMQTQDILAGVRTGGWAAVPPERKELALDLQQPKPSVRSAVVGRVGVSGGLVSSTKSSAPPQTALVRSSAGSANSPNGSNSARFGVDARGRVAAAAAAQPMTAQPMSARATGANDRVVDDEDSLAGTVSAFWDRFGRKMFVAAIFLGGFAIVVWLFSLVVSGSIGRTQQELADNTANVGAIEHNDISRRQENFLKDAVAHENGDDCSRAIRDVDLLLITRPPATMALDGLLIRARCRVTLRQREAARRDFEEFLRQTPLGDARRATVKAQLDAL